MSEAKGNNTSQWVVFEQTFTGLLQRLPSGTATAAFKTELRAIGLDIDKPLLVAYPYEVWAKLTFISARVIYPGVEMPLAHRQLGRMFVEGYAKTPLGGAVMTLLKIIGPRRALSRTAKSFRSGNNYFESKLEEFAPDRFALWVNEAGTHPQFIAGMLQAALRHCGAHDVQADPRPDQVHGRTFDVKWG